MVYNKCVSPSFWLLCGYGGGGGGGGGDGQQTVGCCTRSCYFCPPAATVRLPRHVAGSASAFNAASRPQPMKARRAGFVFFSTNGSAERLGAAFLRTNGSRGKKKKKRWVRPASPRANEAGPGAGGVAEGRWRRRRSCLRAGRSA